MGKVQVSTIPRGTYVDFSKLVIVVNMRIFIYGLMVLFIYILLLFLIEMVDKIPESIWVNTFPHILDID